MTNPNKVSIAIASAVCSFSLIAGPALAETPAEFYKGKRVSIVIAHGASSGFTVYTRLFAPYFSKYIPGKPAIVIQNKAGASGMIGANWLYNKAPRDGTVIGNLSGTTTFDPLLGNSAAKFDPAKFTWIGNLDQNISMCGVTKSAGVKSIQDLMKTQVVFGATGKSGPYGKYPNAIRSLLGAKTKVVYGYKGTGGLRLAIQREEVKGFCGVPLSTIRTYWKDDYESGHIRLILQLVGKKSEGVKGVPHINDLAKSDKDRKVFDFVFGAQFLGRAYPAPPQIPADRRDALRAAFSAAAKDPKFISAAKKVKMSLNVSSGKQVQAYVERLSASPKDVVARAKQALLRSKP